MQKLPIPSESECKYITELNAALIDSLLDSVVRLRKVADGGAVQVDRNQVLYFQHVISGLRWQTSVVSSMAGRVADNGQTAIQ